MDSSNRWEVLGLVNFVEPFRRTASGEAIISRFTVRSGALVVTGALLLEDSRKRRSITFSSPRDQRVFVETEAARSALVRLVTTQMQEARARSSKNGLKLPLAEAPQNAGTPARS